jgi:hypothetical protein
MPPSMIRQALADLVDKIDAGTTIHADSALCGLFSESCGEGDLTLGLRRTMLFL